MNRPPNRDVAAAPSLASRREGLDALRAGAAILVVMMHAAIPSLSHPMPGLVWPVRDAAPSRMVDVTFWWIEGFVMPLFFLMSGFLAAGLLVRHGPAGFLVHRAKRVLGPMAFGCVVILPFDLYVWALGFLVDGRATLRQLRSLKFAPEIARDLWGFAHLWYLQYLFLCCVGLVVVAAALRRIGWSSAAWRSPAQPVLLGAVGGLVLWVEPNVLAGFQHGFLPALPKLAYSAVYFAAGVALQEREDGQRRAEAGGPWWLAASIPLFVVMVPLIHRQQLAPLDGVERVALAGVAGLFAATMSLGLIGLALRWKREVPAWVRYLAEASFWIYLAHHPLVGLGQVALSRWDSAGLKFVVVTVAVLAATLASYEVAVRNTWVGALLNGRRKRLALEGDPPATLRLPATPAESGRATRAAA